MELAVAILLSGDRRRLGIKPSNDRQDQKVEKTREAGSL